MYGKIFGKPVNNKYEIRNNLVVYSDVKMIFHLERRLPISSQISIVRVHGASSVTETLCIISLFID